MNDVERMFNEHLAKGSNRKPGKLTCDCKSQEEHDMKTKAVIYALNNSDKGMDIMTAIMRDMRKHSSPEEAKEIDDILFFGDIVKTLSQYNKSSNDLAAEMKLALMGAICHENKFSKKQEDELEIKVNALTNKIYHNLKGSSKDYSIDETVAALLGVTTRLGEEMKAKANTPTDDDKAKSDKVKSLIKELTDLLVN